ncbi:VCBS repeat-containing protein [Aliikangiella marina]|uniref:VCBS repeat-containing protein n=1 Tax=Aliikangiella marina TaxID=1712262 RepID=A0A545T169_9GAMM|nr:VCBS repeat-containing protein [Aliikangiella marina]TQV70952.1 VCBS repeat-containing protein [Aliikangiella marina]
MSFFKLIPVGKRVPSILSSSVILSLLACGGSGSSESPAPPTQPPVADTLGSLYTDSTNSLPGGLTGACMDGEAMDFDNDGDLDLVLAFEFTENLILENDGSGNFSTLMPFSNIARDSEDLTVADFDDDGDLDILFVSEDDLIDEFYLNNGDGSFTDVSSRIPVSSTSNAVVAFDINGDGSLDVVIGNNGPNNVLLNDGSANFTDDTSNTFLGADVTQDLELADIDNDGDFDLIVGNETRNEIFINNNDGTFNNESTVRLPDLLAETRDLELGDIDGDGDLDLLVSNVTFFSSTPDVNQLLINDGTGIFTQDNNFSLGGNHVDSDFVDLDRDGDLDIITGTTNIAGGEGNNQALENNGSGSFSGGGFTGSGNLFDIVAADFNGDTKIDLYYCNRGSQDRLYLAN